MRNARRELSILAAVWAVTAMACSISYNVKLTEPPVASATEAISPTPSKAYFRVVVIVDTTSEPVSRQQAEAVMDESSGILSGLVPFEFQMIDFVEDGGGGVTTEMAGRYIESHLSSLPDGMVIFSHGDDGRAELYGGYSMHYGLDSSFRNRFISPTLGSTNVYLAVINFDERYGICGYGDSDIPQSTVSIGGECRNRPGTACVEHNGYSMCEDAVDDLYASTPTYWASTVIIHEFLHSFQPNDGPEKMYHIGSPECNARMGHPSDHLDDEEFQHYNGMCPFIYTDFANAYQP